MVKEEFIIVGIGEVLWDMFPTGKVLGGAPANFAYHAAALGNKGIIASRIGSDDGGREIIDTFKNLKLSTEHIQTDELAGTGTVTVELEPKGQPRYTITEEVAWDYLEWTAEWEQLAKQAHAVCFGSLAQRSAQSYHTIKRFLRASEGAVRVFDINLRQHYYSADHIVESLGLADILKLNDLELVQLMRIVGIKSGNLKANCRALLESFGLKMVCLTRGDRGCMLVNESKTAEHPGFKVKVVDTVGSGDAFTAALVHHFLRRSSIEKTAEAANRLGAFVASKAGGTPQLDKSVLNQVLGGGGNPNANQNRNRQQ